MARVAWRAGRAPLLPALVCLLLIASLCVGSRVHAQEEAAEAKRLFEEGVAKAAAHDWRAADQLLFASLRHAEHPATRFNLVLVNQELSRPLEVARHAWAFLDLPESEKRPGARQQARELLERATRALVALDLGALPHDASPSIDGAPPDLVRDRVLYLTPGPHVLALRGPHGLSERGEYWLAAGVVQPWPRAVTAGLEPPAPAAPTPAQVAQHERVRAPRDASAAALRVRAAWISGGLGAASALSGLAVFAAARLSGRELAHDGSAAAGYHGAADRYGRLTQAIAPLVLTGGLLLAGALALGPRVTRHPSLLWGVSSLALGVAFAGLAGAWLAQDPRPLIPDTDVYRAVPEAGYLWLGAALPLATYGVLVLVARRRAHVAAASGLVPLTVRW